MLQPAQLEQPVVQAPMGGGVSTPALAAAVSEAGGLGFLACGYLGPDAVRSQLREMRERTASRFGANLFAPPGPAPDRALVEAYATTLRSDAERLGVELGPPRHDDDGWEDKLALLVEEAPAVVSFTFGCPSADVVARLHGVLSAVWVTVTTPEEAEVARAAGADALVVQGVEAGGHRGAFDDEAVTDVGVLAALQLVRAAVELPLVASGAIMTGAGVAAVLAAGAAAAQLGTAFMLCPEAATAPVHRDALRSDADTRLTRAFTGRTARGIVNRFMLEHHRDAIVGYPDVHHVTAPMRREARDAGDPDVLHLWAGQGHALAEPVPAAELVRRLGDEARAALRAATRRFGQT